jgi:hypothetical protein
MIDLNPKGSVVLWEGMNLFQTYSYLWNSKITNLSNSDLYLWELCAIREWSPSVLSWNTPQCSEINGNWILMAKWMQGSTYSLPTTPTFIWDISHLGSNVKQGDNIIVTTLRKDGITYNSGTWFSAKLKVRVSKPSVSTTWWGTSYISNPKNISNVTDVARDIVDEDKNKNFAWVGVSTWSLSSYTSEVKDSESVKEVWKEWEKINETTIWTNNINPAWTNARSSQNISDFTNYNWISNAFILKDTKFTISERTLYNLTWARTYIIENADLIINSNISYDDNIAFVVKGWSILIDKWVTSIKGTFISIPKSGVWWKINWVNGKTTEPLLVYGSLYGNVEGLVSNRTYIKQNSSWLLDVWTIVSFGSSVFRDPAPLTTTFINEYLEAQKVAQ